METKLTLKLDKHVIEEAKKYAQSNNTSVSKLVEDYFRQVAGVDTREKKCTPLVEDLSGVISGEDVESVDYVAYLEKKYE